MSLEKMDALFGLVHDTKVVDEERSAHTTSIHEKDVNSVEKREAAHVEQKAV